MYNTTTINSMLSKFSYSRVLSSNVDDLFKPMNSLKRNNFITLTNITYFGELLDRYEEIKLNQDDVILARLENSRAEVALYKNQIENFHNKYINELKGNFSLEKSIVYIYFLESLNKEDDIDTDTFTSQIKELIKEHLKLDENLPYLLKVIEEKDNDFYDVFRGKIIELLNNEKISISEQYFSKLKFSYYSADCFDCVNEFIQYKTIFKTLNIKNKDFEKDLEKYKELSTLKFLGTHNYSNVKENIFEYNSKVIFYLVNFLVADVHYAKSKSKGELLEKLSKLFFSELDFNSTFFHCLIDKKYYINRISASEIQDEFIDEFIEIFKSIGFSNFNTIILNNEKILDKIFALYNEDTANNELRSKILKLMLNNCNECNDETLKIKINDFIREIIQEKIEKKDIFNLELEEIINNKIFTVKEVITSIFCYEHRSLELLTKSVYYLSLEFKYEYIQMFLEKLLEMVKIKDFSTSPTFTTTRTFIVRNIHFNSYGRDCLSKRIAEDIKPEKEYIKDKKAFYSTLDEFYFLFLSCNYIDYVSIMALDEEYRHIMNISDEELKEISKLLLNKDSIKYSNYEKYVYTKEELIQAEINNKYNDVLSSSYKISSDTYLDELFFLVSDKKQEKDLVTGIINTCKENFSINKLFETLQYFNKNKKITKDESVEIISSFFS